MAKFSKTIGVNITFSPLNKSHFPLLLRWLNKSHINDWWDDILWTPKLIQKKYNSYIKGYKIEQRQKKPIKAYIICVNDVSCGYLQIYNAYDFIRSYPLCDLPLSLAAVDMYIGENEYLGQGLGTTALKLFLQNHSESAYTHVLVDPDKQNTAAMKKQVLKK